MGLTFVAEKNHTKKGSIVMLSHCEEILISNSKFIGSGDLEKTSIHAIYSINSKITVMSSLFQGNTGITGGAIEIKSNSTITLIGNTFTENKSWFGGAIHAFESLIILNGTKIMNFFALNSVLHHGGAIFCFECSINLSGSNRFENNSCNGSGGAICMYPQGILHVAGNAYFSHNEALEGGAIHSFGSDVFLSGTFITFEGNLAKYGGALYAKLSIVMVDANSEFISNVAELSGGAINPGSSDPLEHIEGLEQVVISGTFVNNTAGCGGAVAVSDESNITFNNVYIHQNSNSGMCILNSNVTFDGITRIMHNTGKSGGGIQSRNSHISFWGETKICGNSATIGGGIGIHDSGVLFNSVTVLKHNSAHSKGAWSYVCIK